MKIGVIIGRFQTPRLTDGHRHMIDTVLSENDMIVVMIGSTGLPRDTRNPLTFKEREHVLRQYYPSDKIYGILEIFDRPEDEMWSLDVDTLLSKINHDKSEFRLYSGRDGFSKYYSGKYEVVEVLELKGKSATEIRSEYVSEENTVADERFAKGVITALSQQFPVAYSTVGCLVVNPETDEILFGRKSGETKYRLPGGFVDPSDNSIVDAAIRELSEEVKGISCAEEVLFLANFKVDDWRYRKSESKIFTNLFLFEYTGGMPVADDDLVELIWVNANELDSVDLVESHRHMLNSIRERAIQE